MRIWKFIWGVRRNVEDNSAWLREQQERIERLEAGLRAQQRDAEIVSRYHRDQQQEQS